MVEAESSMQRVSLCTFPVTTSLSKSSRPLTYDDVESAHTMERSSGLGGTQFTFLLKHACYRTMSKWAFDFRCLIKDPGNFPVKRAAVLATWAMPMVISFF